MGFDLTSVTQGLFFIEVQKYKMLSGIEYLGKKSQWTGLLALPAAVGYLSLDIIKIVTFIGEAVIKGLAHLFGSPFNPNCSAKKAVCILLCCLPISIVLGVNAVQHAILVFYKTLVEPNNILRPVKINLDGRAKLNFV